MGDDSRRRRPAFAGECGVDRISCLPDELLHVILLCLDSSRAAGRTSVLSHRWRRVWAHLPALVLFDDELPPPSSSFPDTVDAALATYAAPILQHLSIWVPDHGPGPGPGVPAHRVSPWLHFTSQRVTGSFSLNFRPNVTSFVAPEVAGEEAEELELPACSAATWITLNLEGSWRLRTAGVFLALTRLEIQLARMEGGVLSDLVSTQCPRLKKLSLLVTLVAASDVSIHSDSLQSLSIFVRDTRRLEVIATGLEELHLWTHRVKEVHISAPKLAKVAWCGAYDPCQHQFILAPRSLRLLTIEVQATSTSLMRQFDEVDELSLQISIPQGLAGYQSFLNEINKIPKCEALSISLACNEHGLAPTILHLFRCCNSVRKLSTELIRNNSSGPSLRYSCPSACPCHLAESYKIDNNAFGSLEVVEINSFVGSYEEMEFVEQLSKCNAAILKSLVINCTTDPAPSLTKEVCEKARSSCHPNLKVEFYVISSSKQVRFD